MLARLLRRRGARWAALGILVLGLWIASRFVCLPALLQWGLVVEACPDGTPRQTIHLRSSDLRRNASGEVQVSLTAHYATDQGGQSFAALGRFQCELALVADGKETPLTPEKGWSRSGVSKSARVTLPEVPDGEYLLRAKVKSALGRDTLDLPLPLFAPARVHVLTDRPLYEPGNTVRFRAVVLRARGLAPLERRPGRWLVIDPSGERVLEERAPTDGWGVVAGSLPLDSEAASGTWQVRWESGEDGAAASFRVEPFTLPRFRVEASAEKSFYAMGERPVVRGAVVYSSGAPVSAAKIAVQWSPRGPWPVPTSWSEGALPAAAVADASGRFVLALPEVPRDLIGQLTLEGRLAAVDAAGDQVVGSVAVLLSQEPIRLNAVTELQDGLAQGFNNRVYLRVTDAAGRVLPGADLRVKRAWEPGDEGVSAQADEDGVASLQLDPGPPVNVIVPPMPVRPAKRQPIVARSEAEDLLDEGGPGLADLRALDGWSAALEPCARFGASNVELAMQVDPSGLIAAVGAAADPLSECVAGVVRSRQLPAGKPRLLRVGWSFSASDLPMLSVDAGDAVPSEPEVLDALLARTAADARRCLPRTLSQESALPRGLVWRLRKGSKQLSFGWTGPLPEGEVVLREGVGCVEASFRPVELDEPAEHDALGLVTLRAVPVEREGVARPQATTMLGYEFVVDAKRGKESLGSAKLRLPPGTVPPVRLRAVPVLPQAGGELAVEILRGPDFRGELPKKLRAQTENTRPLEAEVDAKRRRAVFKLPSELEGWIEVSFEGARAVAYVQPKASLALSVRSDREQYAPGQTAQLQLTTTVAGKGAAAAVGLFGVDQTLEQLVPLPGPDALAELRPQAESAGAAFGALDVQALVLGRIRGAHAAAATVTRVSALPAPTELDRSVSVSASSSFDPTEEVVDRFYRVLRELHVKARQWEQKAPPDQQMDAARMARLWSEAVAACEKRGERVTDAFGRRLRLSHLPPDLLALTDPRAVLVEGTRLPEDVENWSAWVAEELP